MLLSPPSALHDLALAGDAKGLSAFLATKEGKASSLDKPDTYGFTPLQLATDRGKPAFRLSSVWLGARSVWPTLTLACCRRRAGHLEVVKALIGAGANKDLKVRLTDRSTLLMH